MKEIIKAGFDKISRSYYIEYFDEEEGWIKLNIDDIDTLIDRCDQCYDRIDINSFDESDMEIIKETLEKTHLLQKQEEIIQYSDIDGASTDYDYSVFYITDIHLDEKVSRLYGKRPSSEDEDKVVSNCINNIVNDYNEVESFNKILLIGGDVSHNFHIVESFYKKLTESIPGKRIMAILGNHELWNYDDPHSDKESLDDIIDKYRKLFNSLYISFAENMLFTYKGRRRYYVVGDELLKASDEEIQEYVSDSRITILGGIGFAGLNDTYNCESGLYNNTIVNKQIEKELSQKFNAIYKKVLQAVPKNKIIVFTHMPISDWSDQEPNPNWIYVNGHTHRNKLSISDGSRVYSDNQIGYGGTVHLKHFFLDVRANIFLYYPDGIHEISRELYKKYYINMGISMRCNHEGNYYMVKRCSLLCFFLKKDNTLYILDGGIFCKVNNQNLDYYYDNLPIYGEKINNFMKNYLQTIRIISSFVKQFGGDGRVHGCIVDIDYFNHLYLNPFDGKITAYMATDIVNKIIYENLSSLLESERIDLYDNYMKMIDSENTLLPILEDGENKYKGPYLETDIYKVSRFFYKMQHCIDYSVIRRWNDALLRSTNIEGWNTELMNLLYSNMPKMIK